MTQNVDEVSKHELTINFGNDERVVITVEAIGVPKHYAAFFAHHINEKISSLEKQMNNEKSTEQS